MSIGCGGAPAAAPAPSAPPNGVPVPILPPATSPAVLTWSADGDVLAFAEDTAVVRLWMRTGEARSCATGHLRGTPIATLRVTGDGSDAIAGARDQRAYVCNRRDNGEVDVPGPRDSDDLPVAVGISRDGSVVTTRAQIQVRGGGSASLDDLEGPYAMCAGGDWLIARRAQTDRMIAVSLPDLRQVELEGFPASMPWDPECARGGRYLAMPSGEAWSLTAPRRLPAMQVQPLARARPGPDADQIVLEYDDRALVIAVADRRTVREIPLHGPYALQGADRIATADGSALRIEAAGTAQSLELPAPITSLAWHPSAPVLAVAADRVYLFDARASRIAISIVDTSAGSRWVATDRRGHVDGTPEALAALEVRMDGQGPALRASELDRRWIAPLIEQALGAAR